MNSLSIRFLLAFVAIILITTLAAGVPAYITIRTELERQAWTRITDGGRVTQALLETEKTRLIDLAELVAQRPTLQELAQQRDAAALNEYLSTFCKTVDLDVLILSDRSGAILARGATYTPVEEPPIPGEAAFRVLVEEGPKLALLASKDFQVKAGQEFLVTVGILFDDAYARKLADETGFEHSFLLGTQRFSTTLRDIPPTATAIDKIEVVNSSGRMETATLDFQSAHYYIALIPMFGSHGEVVGLSEVVLHPIGKRYRFRFSCGVVLCYGIRLFLNSLHS